ncbi:MAG: DUF1127 domain-containing protein [Dongiaceae bacterium]
MSSLTIGSSRTSRDVVPQAESWRAVLMKSIGRRFARIISNRRMRRDIDLLRALDDRMLTDIGLSRWDVEYAVRHGRPPGRANDQLGC